MHESKQLSRELSGGEACERWLATISGQEAWPCLRTYIKPLTRCRSESRASGGIFEIDAKCTEREQLERQISREDLWDDPKSAQELMRQRSTLQETIGHWEDLQKHLDEQALMLELAEGEAELSVAEEISTALAHLERDIAQTELARMLSGPDDEKNAILTIHAGAGGTESQDWAEMLLRMYLRWTERKGFRTQILDTLPGEEAGVKGVTVLIEGKYAYGYAKAESGVHRLVRISPFDANNRRHTSFASVFVIPEIADDIQVVINEADLRIETFRAGGHGGQHVNVTDSAVRIIHIPTGIVTQCQNERSQHKNRASAMKVLRSRLYEIEKEKRTEKIEQYAQGKKEIAWGHQIRSYVLHPYRLVKDHRTDIEVGNVEAVLDGDLDLFIEQYLLGYR
jgi:peptide chain release factor 2